MDRIRREEVYINWYYHQALSVWGGVWGKPCFYKTKSWTEHLRTIRQEPNSSVTWRYFPQDNRNSLLKRRYFLENRNRNSSVTRLYFPENKHEFLGCTSHRRNMNSSFTRRCFPQDNNTNSLTCITFDKTEVTLGWSESNCPHYTYFHRFAHELRWRTTWNNEALQVPPSYIHFTQCV